VLAGPAGSGTGFSGICLLMLCLPGAAPSNAPGFHATKHTSYHSLLFSPCHCHVAPLCIDKMVAWSQLIKLKVILLPMTMLGILVLCN
jgi:hypothetical protein